MVVNIRHKWSVKVCPKEFQKLKMVKMAWKHSKNVLNCHLNVILGSTKLNCKKIAGDWRWQSLLHETLYFMPMPLPPPVSRATNILNNLLKTL